MRGRIGGAQMHGLAALDQPQGQGRGDRRLAHAPFAGEEQTVRRLLEAAQGARGQPGLHRFARRQATAEHDLVVNHDGRSGQHAVVPDLFGGLNLGDLDGDTRVAWP
jgi:hypothetical protein